MDHHRCHKTYIPKTRSERDTNTVTFLPHKGSIPIFTQQDHLRQAIDDILHILKNPTPAIPSFLVGDDTSNAICLESEIFNKNMQQSSITESIDPKLQEKIASYYKQTPTKHHPYINKDIKITRVPHTMVRSSSSPFLPSYRYQVSYLRG